MKQFNLMRRLSKEISARCAKGSFYEFTNKPNEWMAAPATGEGLIEILEEAERRIKGTESFISDQCNGFHHEYFVEVDGVTILSADDLIEMMNFYIDLRSTQDEEFVIGYFSREVIGLVQH